MSEIYIDTYLYTYTYMDDRLQACTVCLKCCWVFHLKYQKMKIVNEFTTKIYISIIETKNDGLMAIASSSNADLLLRSISIRPIIDFLNLN